MKAFFIILLSFLIARPCCSQTQLEMNESANTEFLKADNELNVVYKSILTEYKSDTVFIKNLRVAQRLWIQLREAEMIVKYPEEAGELRGSIAPMCWSLYKEALTRDRIKMLRIWLSGIEGDACSGSVKTK